LGFVSVLDFFGVLSFPKTGEMGKTELWPFLTILGTRMRAASIRRSIGKTNLHTPNLRRHRHGRARQRYKSRNKASQPLDFSAPNTLWKWTSTRQD
jgi:hypothetical protein